MEGGPGSPSPIALEDTFNYTGPGNGAAREENSLYCSDDSDGVIEMANGVIVKMVGIGTSLHLASKMEILFSH